jgi:NIMA (never in mitosis gene a)-related kinase
MSPLS